MPNLIDLTGNKYGRLTVLKRDCSYQERNNFTNKKTYWLCQCSCGNIVSKDGYNLTHGKTQSCGCFQKEAVSKAAYKDLTGKVFGRLMVLRRDEKHNHKKRESYYWICCCSCGNVKTIRGSSLLDGSIQSCGCLQREYARESNKKDLKGKRFGSLVAIEETELKKEYGAGIVWKCRCDCGNLAFIPSSALTTGKTCSCGCITSKGNLKIKTILTENNISFETEYSFSDLKNPLTGHRLFFDFAIFTNNKLSYLIEYDGIQHFLRKPQGYFSQECLDAIHERDEIKNSYCRENNIPLIRISYKDYKKITIHDLVL